MHEDLLKLYAQLAEQREQLVVQLDKNDETDKQAMTRNVYGPISSQRLRREILWKEQQIIALLGGVIRYELSG